MGTGIEHTHLQTQEMGLEGWVVAWKTAESNRTGEKRQKGVVVRAPGGRRVYWRTSVTGVAQGCRSREKGSGPGGEIWTQSRDPLRAAEWVSLGVKRMVLWKSDCPENCPFCCTEGLHYAPGILLIANIGQGDNQVRNSHGSSS